jgi:hypothetical protein
MIGTQQQLLGTLVITDANRDAYSYIILRIVKTLSTTDDDWNPELLAILNKEFGVPIKLELIVIGGKPFSKELICRSSTYRERYALIKTVARHIPFLGGRVVCLSDNQNCQKTWHDTEELPVTDYIKFMSHCHRQLWLPRTNAIAQLVDQVARTISEITNEQPELKNKVVQIRTMTDNINLPNDPSELMELIKLEQQSDEWILENNTEVLEDIYYYKGRIMIPEKLLAGIIKKNPPRISCRTSRNGTTV